MAKILFTAFLADARNKLNGNVFSKNRYGAYIRNKVTPTNPQTTYQQGQRQMLGALSAQWRGLTQAQRDGWIAATAAFQRPDIFGKNQALSGNALFVSLNKNLLNSGNVTIDSAPAPVEIPTLAVSALTATASTASVTFTVNPGTLPTDTALFVKACAPVSAGKLYVKNLLRFLGTFTPTTGSVDISTEYSARFGDPVEGQRITVEAFLVSTVTGQAGVPVSVTAIVAA